MVLFDAPCPNDTTNKIAKPEQINCMTDETINDRVQQLSVSLIILVTLS